MDLGNKLLERELQLAKRDSSIVRLMKRREALSALSAIGLLACGSGDSADSGTAAVSPTPAPAPSPTPTPTPTPTPSPAGACVLIPQETQGPYPLLAILGNSAMVRQSIAEGHTGIALNLAITLVNVNASCAPIANAAVYVWHCDKDGAYSGYSQPGANTVGQTFCRGIQVTDSNGQVTFTTIYPGWYAGRITHIHFQVYLASNLNVTATATSQIAFPQDVTNAVYNSALYVARGQNTSVTSFSADNVFSDGTTYQMATMSGDIAAGYSAALTVGVAA